MTTSSPSQPQDRIPEPAHPKDRPHPVADAAPARARRALFPAVSTVLILHPEQPDRFLLVRQAASGATVLPGGKAEWGESPRQTARREAAEETGVEVEVLDLLVLNWLSEAAGKSLGGTAYPCFLSTFAGVLRPDQVGQLVVPDGELRDHLWLTYDQAAQPGRMEPLVLNHLRTALNARADGRGAHYLES
ncbi:8-oxo-dGTP pyrophosphatase MutT (NUDIX family) [Streptacidiphilus sp. BW17]|uniref:NUDIX domain-containing protein n=1 Tax=Streptacidiphilus sp. BW17 TaxID=3156274 RepID=UPI0035160AD7